MKVTYTEKGIPFDFKRIDTIRTFHCIDYWQPENCELIYFRLNRFEVKTVPEKDVIRIEP